MYLAQYIKEEAKILAPVAAIEDNPIWILALRQRSADVPRGFACKMHILSFPCPECAPMKLAFPNPNRSFDQSSNRVRFWGYDRSIEVSFFVDAAALKRLCPGVGAPETGYVEAFDEARSRIHEVADQVYKRGDHGKGAYAYVLSAADF